MIDIRRSDERGHADHGWLDTYHTFSFADYYDPEFVQFGLLRVLNQDRVTPGMGFPTHGHRDMEIVSYVLEGVLEHKDSMGNGSQMWPGEVQLMSAGTGVTHSEFNGSEASPCTSSRCGWCRGSTGRSRATSRSTSPTRSDRAGYGWWSRRTGRTESLTIGQDARLYTGLFAPDEESTHAIPADRSAWLHVATGSVEVNGQRLGVGDGAALREEESVTVRGAESANVVLWELPRV